MKTNMITKGGRLSKVWANHFTNNRIQYRTWSHNFDGVIMFSVIKVSDFPSLHKVTGNLAFQKAIHTYFIKNDFNGLTDLDRDFIAVFGQNANMFGGSPFFPGLLK